MVANHENKFSFLFGFTFFSIALFLFFYDCYCLAFFSGCFGLFLILDLKNESADLVLRIKKAFIKEADLMDKDKAAQLIKWINSASDREIFGLESPGTEVTNWKLPHGNEIEMFQGDVRANLFPSERQRREHLNEKYKTLRALVPNPTKPDRASIVRDAIVYIKELMRTVDELKILVEKKRCGSDRRKKLKMEDEAVGYIERLSLKPLGTKKDKERTFNGSLRSYWLQRTSKDGTPVDVRIIDDEVNINLTLRKKTNCLLSVSRILDELQLETIHVTGENIGDDYIFKFKTKIVNASAITKKLIEVVDGEYPTFSSKL